MSNSRKAQIEELLFRTLARILLEEYEFPEGVTVSVSKVNLSGDLKVAKISLSVYPFSRSEEIFSSVIHGEKHIRYKLAENISLKQVPTIQFFLDTREEKAEEIIRLMDNAL